MYKLELVYAWCGGTRPCPMGGGTTYAPTMHGCIGGGGGHKITRGKRGHDVSGVEMFRFEFARQGKHNTAC
jgi:hypothetical protein